MKPEPSVSSDLYLADDPISNSLRSQGFEIFNYRLSEGSSVVGGLYKTEDAELAYRYLPEEHSLLLLYFRRIANRKGLLNPFREISRITDLCANLGLKEISGYVSGMFAAEGGLSQERMVRFYERKFKATLFSRKRFYMAHERSKRIASGLVQGPMTSHGDYFMFLDLDEYRSRIAKRGGE
jgi:type III secretion system regulator LcrR